MNFLKKLFGGGGGRDQSDLHAVYFYVRPKRCDEILKVRVDTRNDLSASDEGGYFVRKIVRGERCPFPAELHINFDDNRRISKVDVQDGEAVEEQVYNAWNESKAQKESTPQQ